MASIHFERTGKESLLNPSSDIISASVGDKEIFFSNPVSFILALEKENAELEATDKAWFNMFCRAWTGRGFKEVASRRKSTNVRFGVDSNSRKLESRNIVFQKAASWPKNDPKRVYFDAYIDGKRLSYYIVKTGKGIKRYIGKQSDFKNFNFDNIGGMEKSFLGIQDVKKFVGIKTAAGVAA